MDPQRIFEIDFWQGLYNELGPEDFIQLRQDDYANKTGHFPELANQGGRGLDLGCGLVSIFEFSDRDVVAVDPLCNVYREIFEITGSRVACAEDTDVLEDASMDWVFCANVIDHTPDPARMVGEILRLLKPGGTLYFQVNFDPEVSACHYRKWTLCEVDQFICQRLILQRAEVSEGEYPGQKIFWGVFTRP